MGLSDAACRKAQPRAARYKLADGDGLYLLILPSGAKSWRWRRQVDGRETTTTLGSYPAMGLAEARRARDAARVAPASSPLTLAEAAEAWLSAQSALWKPHHAADVRATLETEIFPALGARPIQAITTAEIAEALRTVQARGAVELAHRLRQRLSAVYRFTIAGGLDMPDRAAPVGAALAPVVRQGRQPAVLTLAAARDALAAAERQPAHPVTRLALRLLALTALRPGELRFGEWREVGGETWTIPAARMKHKRAHLAGMADHVVPLARQAVECLAELRRFAPGALMFPSWSNPRRPISENAIGYLLLRAGLGGRQTGHGWRATFSTIMNERRPADRAAIDLMLAHAPRGVEAAYNRASHAKRRREIAQEWADLLLADSIPLADLVAQPRK